MASATPLWTGPISTSTRSRSTSLRVLVRPTSGLASSSSLIHWISRPPALLAILGEVGPNPLSGLLPVDGDPAGIRQEKANLDGWSRRLARRRRHERERAREEQRGSRREPHEPLLDFEPILMPPMVRF